MKLAITAAAGTVLAFAALAPLGRAADIENYRWTPEQSNCRVVDIHTTNRWGTDVVVRKRICG